MKFLALIGMFILTGCSHTLKQAPTVAAVGPAPGVTNTSTADGTLIVYSERRISTELSRNQTFFSHTPYQVFAPDGTRVRWVKNLGPLQEETYPTPISLPAGNYLVRAEHATRPVVVPIVIETGRTTIVNTDTTLPSDAPGMSGNVVRLDSGLVVGFRATGGRTPRSGLGSHNH